MWFVFPKCGETSCSASPAAAGDNTPKSKLSSTSAMNDSLISVLHEMRFGDASKSKVSKRKKLNVEPGKSVGLADFPSTSTDWNLEEESKGNNEEDHDANQLDDSIYFVENYFNFCIKVNVFQAR